MTLSMDDIAQMISRPQRRSGDIAIEASRAAVGKIIHKHSRLKKANLGGSAYLQDIRVNGGRSCLESIRQFGVNEKEKELQFYPWFEELILLIADFRVPVVITSGCSQLAKTLSNTLVMIDTQLRGRLATAWFYDTGSNMDANAPEQYQPIAREFARRMEAHYGIKLTRRSDRKLIKRYQFMGVTAFFSFASTSSGDKRGKAKAGGAAVSFTANALWEEEKSQWPDGADVTSRIEASEIPTRPRRPLGTAGGGEGIERDMVDADYWFYPHIDCPSCGRPVKLDPKGCLLKEFVRLDASGNPYSCHLSPSGRPQETFVDHQGARQPDQWFHHDADNSVNTAYIGCPHCEAEIPDHTRVYESEFRCIKTGIRLADFLASLNDWISTPLSVAIQISPLLRKTELSLATKIIHEGLNDDPEDWQQQKLGHPSVSITNGLTLALLERSWNAPRASTTGDKVILAGGDLGASEHWLWIAECILPEGWNEGTMGLQQIIERTAQNVLFADGIHKNQIQGLLDEYGVTFGLVDNEPYREFAAALSEVTVLQMADQSPKASYDVKMGTVTEGGEEHDCWFIRNEKFLRAVQNLFLLTHTDGLPLMRLPEHWARFRENRSDRSPVAHMLGPKYNPATRSWERPRSHNDDRYYACMFQQAALHIWLQEYGLQGASAAPIVDTEATPPAQSMPFGGGISRKGIF